MHMQAQCSPADNTSDLAQRIADIRDVLGILDLRIRMEMEAVRLAALRRDQTHIAELAQALADMRNALRDGRSTVEADHRFHHLIAEATGNPLFVRLLTHLGHKAIPRARVDTPNLDAVSAFDYLNRLNDEHQAIYEAIARCDAEAASTAMHRHLIGSRHRLYKVQLQLEEELVERNRSGDSSDTGNPGASFVGAAR
jgi:GntR family transcriptional repressor for pyruvate dehydrogenase complex